jgi:ArsR family transcriptional regulator
MDRHKIEAFLNRDIQNKYEQRAKIMKALDHPTRVFLIDELGKSERFGYELTKMVGADTSAVSKHTSILKEVGLVEYDKKGT